MPPPENQRWKTGLRVIGDVWDKAGKAYAFPAVYFGDQNLIDFTVM